LEMLQVLRLRSACRVLERNDEMKLFTLIIALWPLLAALACSS
jgi:nitrate reductase NapE component